MNSIETAATASFAGISFFIMGAFVVLMIVARWNLFAKAGVAGWKSLIPIYADYIQWKIGWNKSPLFWVMFVLAVTGLTMIQLGGYPIESLFAMESVAVDPSTMNIALIGFGSLLILVGGVLEIIAIYKLFKSFGHGAGWTILFLLFPNIMMLVLGLGSSSYRNSCD